MCLRLDLLDLVAGRFPRRIARQPLLARLQEVLRPTVVKILVNAFLAAQFSDAVLAAQTRNTMRIFSSAEYCRRVARRISRIRFSASSESDSAFVLIARSLRG